MLAKLTRLNQSYIREHGPITQEIAEKVDRIRWIIEARSSQGVPVPGDIVVLHGQKSKGEPVVYDNGHLEQGSSAPCVEPGYMAACTMPMTPHAHKDGTISASGGYWLAVPVTELKLIGMRRKLFWTWGRTPCGNGGVYFEADVNVWEYTNREKIY